MPRGPKVEKHPADVIGKAIKVLPLLIVGFISPVVAQQIGPAPNGEPAVVAQKIIHENFDKKYCPLVVMAMRLGDGSIKAICNNDETFRVFYFQPVGYVAMKCSAVVRHGVPGC